MLRTNGLNHVALTVRDLDRALEFYATLFGMEEQYRGDGMLMVQTPGMGDDLTFVLDPTFAGGAGGLVHLGFRVLDPADVDLAAELVLVGGGTVVEQGELGPGEPYVLARDPDGYAVEIAYIPPS
ncbi:MAG: VOC family protein [bacterium]